jgi:hypothetical protein
MDQYDAAKAFRIGNNRGEGYAPYTDEAGDDTIDEAVRCFKADGWTVVFERYTSEEVAVVRNADGEYVAIGGDATGRGAWAVPIEQANDVST